MPSSQNRLPLSRALADHDQRPASTLKALQISESLTASAAFPDGVDEAKVNATGGAVVLILPAGSKEITGITFSAVKTDASGNAVSLARSGSDTFAGGGTSVSTTTQHGRIGAYWDGANWRNALAASAPVPAGVLLAANNLSDVANAGTARATLGSTVVGDAIFVAANAAAVWTALGLGDYVDDVAAAAGGVAIGQLYHTAGVAKVRLV